MIEKEEPKKVIYSDWVHAVCPYCNEESIGKTDEQAYKSLTTVKGRCDACGRYINP